MENTDSKLSTRSKSLFWNLKQQLSRCNVNLKYLIFKLFQNNREYLRKGEFVKVIRFGDLKVTFDEIDSVFDELQEGDAVSVAAIEEELRILQNPLSSLAGLEKLDGIQECMLAGLKEVKSVMVNENPHYIFDLYDLNKDGCLDIEELNNLIVACSKLIDVDTRKAILKMFLKKLPQNKISKKQFLTLFGLENVPKRITLPAPAAMMKAHDDKELALKYVMQSRIAAPQDIKKFQQINVQIYPQLDDPWKPDIFQKPQLEVPKKQQPQQPVVKPSTPPIKNFSPIPVAPQVNNIVVKPVEPVRPPPKVEPLPPPKPVPPPAEHRDAERYYRLQTKHPQMLDLLEFYLKNKETFVDDETPATSKGQYLHAKDIFKAKYFLFNIASSVFSRERNRTGLAQLLEPKDIIQGSLGDCYFLSSIASLVEYYPELLSELFMFDINPSGLYVVRLFNDGEWSSIVLDDRFPCVYGKPIFAKPHGNEIWVLLLEKAWAKLHGSYQSIDMGSSMEALIALTGAPCKFYRKEDDDTRKAIQEGFDSGSVVTCSGSDELNDLSTEVAERIGLIQRHAYSVQRLVEVGSGSNKQLLVKIRNPWGNDQWKGDWSFSSSKWTESLRKEFNYTKNPQDGSFYMPWDQFQKYFGSVTVCKIVPNAVSSSFRSMNLRHKSSYIRMSIPKKGIYTISIYQESKRKYYNTLNYDLSQSRLVILKMEKSGDFKYVKSSTKQSSNLHVEAELAQGEYMLSCKVIWVNFEEHECVIASYGPSAAKFAAHRDRSITTKFKSQMIKSYASMFSGDKYHYEKLNIAEAYREVLINIEHGLGFIRVNNPTKKPFSTTIVLNKAKGIKVIKPGENPLKLTMMPETESLTGFFISAKGYSYSLEEKMKGSI